MLNNKRIYNCHIENERIFKESRLFTIFIYNFKGSCPIRHVVFKIGGAFYEK